MHKYTEVYKKSLIFILALYVYFGKGIAYSFLAEIMLFLGIFFLIYERHKIRLSTNIRFLIILFFLFINLFYLIRGCFYYPLFDVIRDSFILNYTIFILIVFLYSNNLKELLTYLFKIYKYFPFVLSILYIFSLNKYFGNISIFGNIHLLYFKFGDILVHLYVSVIFYLSGHYSFNKKVNILYITSTVFLFFISSSYSRGGMLSFILAICVFLLLNKNTNIKTNFKSFVRYLIVSLVLIIPLILILPKDENFQGRKAGLDQISTNVTSIVSDDDQGSLSDNKIWRLLWWAKIIDYTFGGEYFLTGKGLGLSLAQDDDIDFESNDSDLRSPHNYHLSILARYGVPIFFIWLTWIILTFKRLKSKTLTPLALILITIQIAFIFNATFDVFLEGPMGAFPFWIFVGIDFLTEIYQTEEKYQLNDIII